MNEEINLVSLQAWGHRCSLLDGRHTKLGPGTRLAGRLRGDAERAKSFISAWYEQKYLQ